MQTQKMRYFVTMTSVPNSRIRPLAVLVATIVAASALVGLGASAANATGTTFKTHKPSISGTVQTGHTVGVTMTTWSPKPTTKTYQWLENGANIAGATSSKYALTSADIGQSLQVEVTGLKDGYTSQTVESAAKTVEGLSFTKAGTPKVTGSAKVDQTLTASTGAWTPAPTSFTYQWKSNKVAISGATSSTYSVGPNDAGKTITVTVTASLAGYEDTAKTSSKTATIVAQTAISKNGTHVIGGGLAAGTYVTTSKSLDFCYWERDAVTESDGKHHDIIANNIITGQGIVTIEDGDYSLFTDGCGTWIRLSDAPNVAKTTFKSGDYAVGQQIAPGTYTAKGGKECNWERLDAFTGDDDINNQDGTDIGDGGGSHPVVTIQASDAGIESLGCGTWTPAP
jgi:hypothetical protein